MSRILLADDSAHAQRIGECILREEGFEVVSVTDGDTALVRLADVDPDVILASVQLPRKNGFEICRYVKEHVRQRHTRVVLTAGAQDPLDEEEAQRVQADGSLRKPFEASLLVQTLKPLVEAAQRDREQLATIAGGAPAGPDPELVRAAVTLALDAAFPKLVEEITARVVGALGKSGDLPYVP
jgi:CheY-like chemotaxis protein